MDTKNSILSLLQLFSCERFCQILIRYFNPFWLNPGSAASGFDNSFYMGSPQIGSHASNVFKSFPRPHSSPKMKLRLES